MYTHHFSRHHPLNRDHQEITDAETHGQDGRESSTGGRGSQWGLTVPKRERERQSLNIANGSVDPNLFG